MILVSRTSRPPCQYMTNFVSMFSHEQMSRTVLSTYYWLWSLNRMWSRSTKARVDQFVRVCREGKETCECDEVCTVNDVKFKQEFWWIILRVHNVKVEINREHQNRNMKWTFVASDCSEMWRQYSVVWNVYSVQSRSEIVSWREMCSVK